jgi:phytoene dehydrogenase-like protein
LEYLSSYLTEPQLITLLSGLCIYGGVEPQHASALFMIAMFYSYHQGAYYPMGSTQRFVDTLAQAIRRHGGTIRRRATVQKILVDRREGVTGVQLTTGEEFTAHTVISNADATKTLNTMLTDGQLPNSLQRRLKRAEYGPSAVALYLAVRDGEWSTRIQSHETFYLPDWQPLTAKHFYYRPGQPSHPYVFSLSVPSLSEPALAPAGHHVISLTGLAHTAEIEQIREEQGKAVIEQDICAHLERLLPGVNACIIYREVATPRTFERYTSNGQGAIYGWAKNTQHFTNGLSIQSPIKGLYLAGHWTQGAHGVYGSFLAGVAVAQKIQRAQRISRQFQLAANL